MRKVRQTFMWLPNDPNKYTSQFKYVEVANYIPPSEKYPKPKVARLLDWDTKESVLLDENQVQAFAKKHNNLGIYTSIFQYNSKDLASADYMASLYFDLDNGNLEIATEEVTRLANHLLQYVSEDALRIYFSGGKGFHVECEAIALNTGTSENLPEIFNFIAHDLAKELDITSMDFVVYDARRMWRAPNSQHQKSFLYKVPCKQLILDSNHDNIITALQWLAGKPAVLDVPEQNFEPKANAWYREYVYKYEQSKLHRDNPQDLLARFMEQGSGNVREFGTEKVFDKFKLFMNCPTVKQMADKAEKFHHLEHYERLFLCSLLTYTDDAILFLHQILSQCSDYNFEVSNSHVQDWIRRREYEIGGRPLTCDKAKQLGIMCTGCDKMEPKKKIIQLGDKYVESTEFSSPSPIRWAYSIPKGNIK